MASRRAFLKLAGAAAAGAIWPQRLRAESLATPEAWPSGPDIRLGRGALGWGAAVLSRPHPDGTLLGHVYPDDVVQIMREVVGLGMAYHTHVWFELERGYVYSPFLQPVMNLPQTPLTSLPASTVWVETVVPYVIARSRPDPAAPEVDRYYYSSVFFIAETVTGADGQIWYRVGMETGSNTYAPGSSFRPIEPEELTPTSPEVDPAEKLVVVYLARQAISAFEGRREVWRAPMSSGANYFGDDGVTILNGTPRGHHVIWGKRVSRHMQGGTLEAGYDVRGVGWVAYFSGNGAALHSTYWHNDFGIPKSHGCLNLRPDDAKWLFRWTVPAVPYDPGDITVNWDSRGTTIDLRET
jgi:lipoprotein-anchoring transpeptidase ErfK/SrfK